ncbi:hypothetical protein AGMMS49982_14110 [Bacteroidia bacterium]|nr:hypothetical protein AGMMS49982_14110 [Bacteroidia bacterium]
MKNINTAGFTARTSKQNLLARTVVVAAICLSTATASAQTSYIDASGTAQTTPSAATTITNQTTLTDGWYVVTGNVTVGSRITVSATGTGAHLILADDCNFTVDGGIKVEGSNKLTIYGQAAGSGNLIAQNPGDYNAGIGSNSDSWTGASGGNITINGGTVTANGGAQGSGIGSGKNGDPGTIITINGGTVNATGTNGAGIGGGDHSQGGNITINGGTVTASTIGPGAGASTYSLTINGGSIQTSSPNSASNGNGQTVYRNTLTLGSDANTNTAVTAGYIDGIACAATPIAENGVYGINDVKTDGDGKIYFWLPQSPVPIAAQTGGMWYKNNSVVVPATATLTTFANTTLYTATYTSSGHDSGDAPAPRYYFEGMQPCVLGAGTMLKSNYFLNGWTLSGGLTGTKQAGETFTMPTAAVTLTANWGVSTGNIIYMHNPSPPASGTHWTYLNNVYTIEDGADVTVINSNGSSGRGLAVAANATATITLSGVSITASPPLLLNAGADVTLNLAAGTTNTLTGGYSSAGIYVTSGATLAIEGPGILNATGTRDGAGIGGGGAGSNITINGGAVTATGGTNGAGIGGGSGTQGGNINIKGGTVTASKIGAGTGANTYSLTITGGSIQAPTPSPYYVSNGSVTVYRKVLTVGDPAVAGATAITAGHIAGIACAETPNAADGVYGIKDVTTDGDGKVYFWLPQSDGNEMVRLTASGTEYGNRYIRNASVQNTTLTTGYLASKTPVTFTAAEVGGTSGTESSTGITLTFSEDVSSGLLAAGNITLTNGTGVAVKGTLTGSGTTYTLNLTSVNTAGAVKVGIADFGTSFVVENGNRTVSLFKDATPPTVTSVTPNDATGVSPSTTALSVTFSEEMNTTAGTVALTPNAGLTLTFSSWSNGNTTANYTLSGLANNTTYTYAISNFKDKAGTVMGADNGRTFSTQTPQTITAATYITAAPYSVGHQITAEAGAYTAHDGGAEGVHTYKWYRADDGSGAGIAAIGGATALDYTPVAADFGKYICIETTPVGDAGYAGVPVKSGWIQVGVTLLADATTTGTQTAATITVTGAPTVVYSTAAVDVALTKAYPTDIVTWSASPAVGSFANAASASTTYTPPSAPTGDITLNATLDKAAAPDITFPTADAITYGDALSTSSLTGGTTGRGSFAWQAGTTVPPVPPADYAVEFTPSDLAQYDYSTVADWNSSTQKVVRTVNIVVNKATAPSIMYPSAATITYGAALSTSALSGGTTGYGTFDWTDGTIVPTVTNSGYEVTFTPNANTLANYDPISNLTEIVTITVNKATAPTITYPTATTITYGAALSTATLSGGTTGYGTFDWTDGTIVPTVTNSGYEVTFTPSASTTDNYNTVSNLTETVAITVNKAAAPVITFPTAATITYGAALSTSALSGGTTGYGDFDWTTPATLPTVTNSGYEVTFTPSASTTANYDPISTTTATVAITVGKAAAPSIMYPTAATITYGAALSTSTLSGGSTEYGTFAWTNGTTVPTVTNSGYSVTFTPSASTVANYDPISTTTATVSITVNKAAAPSITYPTATTITYGAALSTSALSGGTTGYGTFDWTDGTIVPTVTNSGYEVTFTPSASTTDNYNTVSNLTETVAITVNKAAAPVITFPTAATITYGAALSTSALSGGTTGYGDFDWTTPATLPTVTNSGYEVTFTPSASTTANYDPISTTTATVAITVNKAVAPTITYPTATAITYGQALSASTFSGGTTTYGDFAWTDGTIVPTVTNSGYQVTFTPDANTLANYDPISTTTATVAITVNKAAAPSITYPTAATITYGAALSTATLSGGTTGYGTFDWTDGTIVPTVTNSGYSVTFTPSASTAANYNTVSNLTETVALTVSKAAAPSITYPTAATITYGEPLSASTLSGGTTGYGTFAWTDGTIVPTVPNTGYQVTFTPSASTVANYNTITNLTATVALTVSKATLTVTPNAGQSKVVGSTDPAYTYEASGWQTGDGTSLLTGDLTRAAGESIGTYAITQGTLTETSGNYMLNFTPGVTFEIKPATSDNTKVSTVAVNGTTLPTGTTVYLADCGTTSAQITITPEESTSQVIYNGTPGSTLAVDIARPDIHDIAYTVQSTDGSEQEYTLQIERRFAFDDIVGMKFNNVLYVNNNPANNGGYTFKNYRWFKNGELISEEQVYSAGDNRTDLLDPTADYSLEVTTKSIDGIAVEKVLHVCPDKVVLEATLLRAYPNPAPSGTTVTVESGAADGSVIRIYNVQGTIVSTQTLVGNKAQLSLPPTSGVYLITVDGESVKIKAE